MQLESVEERFGDRKAKAISHLESIHLSFIDQLNTSVRIANARAAGAKTKKAAEAEGKVFGVKFEIINRSTGDIYYKDKALFRTQSVVDSYVDDIIATAGLKRADFNLRATEKGLVASNALEICFTSGAPLSLSATHAVFTPLCGSGLFTDPLLGAGVLITGKGYPDLATLQLTRAIADTFPNARIFGLVDADPHGLDILSVYTNGSRATKYSYDHDGLALGDRIEWLGVKVSELGRLGVRYDEMLPLSPRDVGKAMKMLQNVDLPVEWRRELCRMLMVNRKAEIEIVSTASNGSSGSYETTGLREGNRLVNYLVARMTA
ncbi:endodeoxyribonuclease [Cryptotrichosporon argae]